MSSPRSAQAHHSIAEVLRTQRRYMEAISEYEAVLALDRNFANALAATGRCKTYIGPVDDASRGIVHWKQALDAHFLQRHVARYAQGGYRAEEGLTSCCLAGKASVAPAPAARLSEDCR